MGSHMGGHVGSHVGTQGGGGRFFSWSYFKYFIRHRQRIVRGEEDMALIRLAGALSEEEFNRLTQRQKSRAHLLTGRRWGGPGKNGRSCLSSWTAGFFELFVWGMTDGGA